jgi:hypothetical protein
MKGLRDGVTSTTSVSTLGKHLRKLGSILTSLRTPNCSCTANIWTLDTVVCVLAFVSAFDAQKEHKSITLEIGIIFLLKFSEGYLLGHLTILQCSDYTVIDSVLGLLLDSSI